MPGSKTAFDFCFFHHWAVPTFSVAGSLHGQATANEQGPTRNADSVKALGAKANAVPFTAKADDQGRLIELVIDMGAVMPSAGKMTTTYSDFGTEVRVEAPPAAEVIEMPKEMLGVVNA